MLSYHILQQNLCATDKFVRVIKTIVKDRIKLAICYY
jgi:hypothetical protein